jgi:hypothetical protein
MHAEAPESGSTAGAGEVLTDDAAEREDLDPSLDTATYTCSCGLVFEAPVNTTVGCPHCGGQQAW